LSITLAGAPQSIPLCTSWAEFCDWFGFDEKSENRSRFWYTIPDTEYTDLIISMEDEWIAFIDRAKPVGEAVMEWGIASDWKEPED
jgi:hypothetical protein